MAAITFTKETKGISVTISGQKTSYSARVVFRGFIQGTVALIDVFPFSDQPISHYAVDVSSNTVTVNGVLFASTATALVDLLRNTVFIADV